MKFKTSFWFAVAGAVFSLAGIATGAHLFGAGIFACIAIILHIQGK